MPMIGPPTYSTSFPGSPIDGDFAILVDSTSNPSWQFSFRYNAGSASAYKWECIGVGGALEGTSNLTFPRAGDYMVEVGAQAQSYGNSGNTIISFTGGGIVLTAAAGGQGGGTQTNLFSIFDRGRMTGLGAGQVITVDNVGTGAAPRQYTRAVPIRLS